MLKFILGFGCGVAFCLGLALLGVVCLILAIGTADPQRLSAAAHAMRLYLPADAPPEERM